MNSASGNVNIEIQFIQALLQFIRKSESLDMSTSSITAQFGEIVVCMSTEIPCEQANTLIRAVEVCYNIVFMI